MTEKLFFHLLDLAILNSSLYFLGRKFHTVIFKLPMWGIC
jgi:hypothetical protein